MQEISPSTWEQMRQGAIAALSHAHVPYSGYPVGAAILADDGNIYTGCNIENAAYLAGLCAECGALSSMRMAGAKEIRAFVAVNGNEEVVVPCGRCRQMLSEFTAQDAAYWMPVGVIPFSEVLPFSFGQDDLTHVPTSTLKN